MPYTPQEWRERQTAASAGKLNHEEAGIKGAFELAEQAQGEATEAKTAATTAEGAATTAEAAASSASTAATEATEAAEEAKAIAEAGGRNLALHATISANAALTPNERTPVNAASAPINVSLPSGQPQGTLIAVEKVDVTAHAVKVSGTILGGTVSLELEGETRVFQAYGTNEWMPIGEYIPLSVMKEVFEGREGPPGTSRKSST